MKSFKFGSGSHMTREEGMCLMETVAYLAGEPHSYLPKCADISITSLAIAINDTVTDEIRDDLLQDLPWRIVGTYDRNFEEQRDALLKEFYQTTFGFMPNNMYSGSGYVMGRNYKSSTSSIILKESSVPMSEFARIGKEYLNKMIILTEIKEMPVGIEEGKAVAV